MSYRTHVVAGLLVALAACSASGDALEPKPGAGGSEGDSGAPVADAGSPDDASPDVDLDAARPLECGDAGFCETRLPRSDFGVPLSLRSVWVVGSNDVWSVTVEGFVLHYDGAQWTIVHRVNHELYAVWATPTSVWVGGEGGLLFHRTAAGDWSRVEAGHLSPIRAIYGTGDDDVWFTRDGSAVDHFDGSSVTDYPIDVPGLRVTTVFGRPGFGTYAAGHVAGTLPGSGIMPDQPYVFELSTSKISIFNTSLTTKTGFVPLSGAVTDSADESQRLFVAGYEHRRSIFGSVVTEFFNFSYCSLGSSNMAVIQQPYDPGWLNRTAPYDPPPQVMASKFPMLVFNSADIRLPLKFGQVARWDGSALAIESLSMGKLPPANIFGAHSHATDAWIVGDGFALKGATP